MLTDFRSAPTAPNYIVLATPTSLLGLTLFKRAFIIFTEVPNSLTELKQAAGRGEREDPHRAIVGAMFTS